MSHRLLLLSLCLLWLGCGRNITPKNIDEPCTRTSQCSVGCECKAGVCMPPPGAGVCMPLPDAGVDGGADAGP